MSTNNPLGLTGKRVAVVGGGSGVGLAVARALVGVSAAIAVIDPEWSRSVSVVEELQKDGATAFPVAGDATSKVQAEAAVRHAAAALNGLDALIHLEGRTASASIIDMDDATLDLVLSSNL